MMASIFKGGRPSTVVALMLGLVLESSYCLGVATRGLAATIITASGRARVTNLLRSGIVSIFLSMLMSILLHD
jgi:hypothetical protein